MTEKSQSRDDCTSIIQSYDTTKIEIELEGIITIELNIQNH